MISRFNQGVIDKIRALYKVDAHAQALFDRTAQRERDATSTTVDRMRSQLGISRGEAVALARRLEEAGCGQFIVGRRGQKSRFLWSYSCISLGKAAAGEAAELEEAEDPLPESEEDSADSSAAEGLQTPLTIAAAKAALASSLGVPVSSIEIIIKG